MPFLLFDRGAPSLDPSADRVREGGRVGDIAEEVEDPVVMARRVAGPHAVEEADDPVRAGGVHRDKRLAATVVGRTALVEEEAGADPLVLIPLWQLHCPRERVAEKPFPPGIAEVDPPAEHAGDCPLPQPPAGVPRRRRAALQDALPAGVCAAWG
jgi:hypothetical protein